MTNAGAKQVALFSSSRSRLKQSLESFPRARSKILPGATCPSIRGLTPTGRQRPAARLVCHRLQRIVKELGDLLVDRATSVMRRVECSSSAVHAGSRRTPRTKRGQTAWCGRADRSSILGFCERDDRAILASCRTAFRVTGSLSPGPGLHPSTAKTGVDQRSNSDKKSGSCRWEEVEGKQGCSMLPSYQYTWHECWIGSQLRLGVLVHCPISRKRACLMLMQLRGAGRRDELSIVFLTLWYNTSY